MRLEDIRRATPADAPQIFKLLHEAFGATYLSYTIYQAPQSVSYLAELIAAAKTGSEHQFFVCGTPGELAGFYYALRRGGESFLNYIAVREDVRGRGGGDLLLGHFQEYAIRSGAQTLSLDVFASNPRAHHWYLQKGYTFHSSHILAQLKIVPPTAPRAGIECGEAARRAAQREEAQRGFSKITCRVDGSTISIGIIAGHACKLLAHDPLSTEHALELVCQLFPERRVVIVTVEQLPQKFEPIRMERAVRLVKPIPV